MANFNEYVENVFLIQATDIIKISPMGGYYLDKIGKEEIRQTSIAKRQIDYRRYFPIGEVGIIDSNVKDLPVLEAELQLETIPIHVLGAIIRMSYDDFIGDIPDMDSSKFYNMRIETALRKIALQTQELAELGIPNEYGDIKGSLLNDSKVLTKISPIIFDDSFSLESPEDIQKFYSFLTDLVTTVSITSKGEFYANQIVIPMDLMKVFIRPVSWYGSLADQSAEDFLKSKSFEVIYSLNANGANGGTIMLLTKEEVELIYTRPVEILTDQTFRQGEVVEIPIRQAFAGAHIYQPLSAFRIINCIEPSNDGRVLEPSASKKKSSKEEKIEV